MPMVVKKWYCRKCKTTILYGSNPAREPRICSACQTKMKEIPYE